MRYPRFLEIVPFVRRPGPRPTTRVLSTLLVVLGLGGLIFTLSRLTTNTELDDRNALLSNSLFDSNFTFLHRLPRIAKLTMVTNLEETGFELGLKTHKDHGKVHDELLKTPERRLKWVMWFDADTVVTNPRIPLDIFLPPPDYSHINLIITRDWNGINAGNFLLRINQWSYRLLAQIMAYPMFRPNEVLEYAEQGALARLVDQDVSIRNATLYAPRLWFNAYQDQAEEDTRGRLLVHFPGSESKWKMSHWIERLRIEHEKWAVELRDTVYEAEIKGFWEALRHARRVINGFEYQAKLATDRTRESGSEEARKAFDERYAALREALWSSTNKPEELNRITDEAVEANKRLVLSWNEW